MSGQGDQERATAGVGAIVEADGTRFRVFAPDHERVEIVFYERDGNAAAPREVRRAPMRRLEGGYHEAKEPAPPGALYKLSPGGGGPFPDPASRSQPFGVHGPSEVVDARKLANIARPEGVSAFEAPPMRDLVVMEVHVGTATPEGTFDALAAKLGHYVDLGVTAIEIMPVAAFPGRRNWGYDGVSLYAPSAVYGGPEGLARLVRAAHEAGLALLVDAVYNHLGPDGNYLRCYAKDYFTHGHVTPWGDAIAVDPTVSPESRAVRDFLTGSAEMYVRDYGVDGLRLDATHAIVDDSTPHFLAELAARVRKAAGGRRVLVIAEDERNDVRIIRPASEGGFGLDGVWADDFHHEMRRAFAGDKDGYFADFTGTAEEIARAVERGWVYEGQPRRTSGEPRGTPAASAPPEAFVHCIQNHDQVGNRALGDRLGGAVSPAAYRAMSALLLLSPSTPLLFMGQEWNARTPFLYFTDHEPELGRLVTEGRRKEFAKFSAFGGEVPDPQAESTFERSKLDWSEPGHEPHAGTLTLYKALLALRAEHPALGSRAREGIRAHAAEGRAVVVDREGGGRRVRLVTLLEGELSLPVPSGARLLLHTEEPRFAGSSAIRLEGDRLHLSGPSAALVELP